MTDELLYEVADQVATITFNRPDRMNTITPRMLNDLSVRLLEADADDAYIDHDSSLASVQYLRRV